MDIFTIFRGELTYPDGFASMVKRAPQQRAEYHGMQALLEEISQGGLEQLKDQTAPPTENLDIENLASAAEKFQNIQAEFSGRSQLLALHALVIAASRRRNTPQIAQDLFQNCWQDHPRFLLEELDMRWKLSALQTFRDLGTTEAQRRCAGELIIFFNMMKLYETERLYSGASAETAFDPKIRKGKKLPLKLTPYSLVHGDLDRNLLGMLWLSAEEDPVLAPLACHLLTEINRDKRNIFRRLRLMRRVLKRRRK
ncbi:hypothetical protein [Shimia sp. R9_3]|uniref:hypothetical protein n=1 Tax=Shimia sp. R9_3 TaxID=2821113 RepID=UPI001ADB56B4|nr:hypothetical protein [Shimia sp. R9_3]MBO9401867.1 hypothetical protein [Shimia sp. R9_3]